MIDTTKAKAARVLLSRTKNSEMIAKIQQTTTEETRPDEENPIIPTKERLKTSKEFIDGLRTSIKPLTKHSGAPIAIIKPLP
jgi:hypothetical protein